MSEGFGFRTILNIRAGRGVLASLGEEAPVKGAKRVFVVTDSQVAGSPAFQDTMGGLRRQSEVTIFNQVEPNPTDTLIHQVARLIHESDAEVIVAFGGGSVMDTAKSASVVAGHHRVTRGRSAPVESTRSAH